MSHNVLLKKLSNWRESAEGGREKKKNHTPSESK